MILASFTYVDKAPLLIDCTQKCLEERVRTTLEAFSWGHSDVSEMFKRQFKHVGRCFFLWQKSLASMEPLAFSLSSVSHVVVKRTDLWLKLYDLFSEQDYIINGLPYQLFPQGTKSTNGAFVFERTSGESGTTKKLLSSMQVTEFDEQHFSAEGIFEQNSSQGHKEHLCFYCKSKMVVCFLSFFSFIWWVCLYLPVLMSIWSTQICFWYPCTLHAGSSSTRRYQDRLRAIHLRKEGLEKKAIATALGRSEKFVAKWWPRFLLEKGDFLCELCVFCFSRHVKFC